MKKKNIKNEKVRKMGKVISVLLALSAIIWLLIQSFSWAHRYDKKALMKQKECWKTIYTIIEKSPKEKAEWIKQTISSERLLLGGVDYCSALAFIEKGQKQ
jgi:hypothetical protein